MALTQSWSTSSTQRPLIRSGSQSEYPSDFLGMNEHTQSGALSEDVENLIAQRQAAGSRPPSVLVHQSGPAIASYGRPPERRPSSPPPQMEKRVVTPPPPASSRPAVGGVINQQPMTYSRQGGFDVSLLDAASRPVYQAITLAHKSGHELLGKLQEFGGQLMQSTESVSCGLKDNLTYEDLLQSLAHDSEQLLTRDWRLLFTKAVIYDSENTIGTVAMAAPVIQEYAAGAAVLTNRRLLLLSASAARGMLLSSTGLDKKSRIYELTASNLDHLYYKPLPLSSVKSVELEAMSGAKASATFSSQPACCSGLCCCFAACCPAAKKRWEGRTGLAFAYNSRVLKMGVRLPPWDRKTILCLELSPELPLSVARDFVVLLQQHSAISGYLVS